MPDKQIVVGFDVDSTLANLTEAMTRIIEQEYNIHIPTSAVTKWNFYVDVLGSARVMLEVMDQAWNTLVIKPQEPMLAETFDKLSRRWYHRMVISSRTYPSHPAVVRWLQDQNIRYDTVTLLGQGLDKFDYPINMLIDDRPKCVEDVTRYPDKFLYLLDQPWNQDVGELPINAERVDSVAHAVDRINEARRSGSHDNILQR